MCWCGGGLGSQGAADAATFSGRRGGPARPPPGSPGLRVGWGARITLLRPGFSALPSSPSFQKVLPVLGINRRPVGVNGCECVHAHEYAVFTLRVCLGV